MYADDFIGRREIMSRSRRIESRERVTSGLSGAVCLGKVGDSPVLREARLCNKLLRNGFPSRIETTQLIGKFSRAAPGGRVSSSSRRASRELDCYGRFGRAARDRSSNRVSRFLLILPISKRQEAGR